MREGEKSRLVSIIWATLLLSFLLSGVGIADETRIYLLRHAEFDTTDPEKMLSQEGRGRAAALADRFKDVKVDYVFSRFKRKLSARAPGRSFSTQQRQALLLGLPFNLYRW